MNGHNRYSWPRWLLPVAVVALVAGPLILYGILPLVGVSAAVASGVVAVVAIKHLGLVAVLLTPLYALLRRRRHR